MVTLKDLQTDNSAIVVRHIFNLYEFVRAYMLRYGGKSNSVIPYINKSGPLVKRKSSVSPIRGEPNNTKRPSTKSSDSMSQGMPIKMTFDQI